MRVTSSARPHAPNGWIHSRPFDVLLFIAMPLVSIVAAYAFSRVPPEDNQILFMDQPALLTSVALKTIIHSHLVIVFFRSHGNPKVRPRWPLRFWLVPLVLFVATLVSLPLLGLVLIVTTFWDVYHSSLQTFGIGRIYDMKAGADVNKGRAFDIALNHLIYIGPLFAGPIWGPLLQVFDLMPQLGLSFGPQARALLVDAQPLLRTTVWIAAPFVVGAYVVHLAKRVRAGERYSWQKHALFATTAVASVAAWGFNSFGQALLVMNLFHAVQYFAIVWWSERDHIGRLFGTGGLPRGTLWSALCLIVVGVGYGFWLGAVSDQWAQSVEAKRIVLALTNSVAMLHFWYDGFVWSVRRRDV
jgi:hypothetical protein